MNGYKLVFGNKEKAVPIIPSLSVYKMLYYYHAAMFRHLNKEKCFHVIPSNKSSTNIFDETNSFLYGLYANILFDEEKLKHVNSNSRLNLFLKYY